MKKTLSVFFTLLLSVFTNLYSQTEFYVSPTGSDTNPGTLELPWKTVSKAANTLTAGQTAYVKAGTYTGGVSVRNSGTAGNYITLMAYPGEQPILDGQGGSSTMMNLGGQSYIKISGFKMQNAYIGISGGKSNLIIENNYLYNFTNPGISLSFVSNALVKGNVADLCCRTSWGECITFNNCEYIDIVNNEVKNGIVNTKGGEGLDVKSSKHMRVYGNVIHDIKKLGLYIDSYDGLNYDIEVFNNLVYNCLDGGIVISSEQRNATEKIWVYNNIVYNSGYVGIAVVNWPTHNDGTLYPINDILIENNTISNASAISIDAKNGTGFVIRNNALYNFSPIVYPNRPPSLISENNISDVGTLSSLGTNGLLADPLFVGVESRNYRLSATSPAIDMGKANNIAFDFDFNARPVGDKIDMGAFEYGSTQKVSITPRVKPEFISITSSITSGVDDGVENSVTKAVNLTGTTVTSKLTSSTNKDIVALRFSSVNIPKGATILNARIQFRNLIGVSFGHDPIQIRAERTGNSTPITTTAGSISSKLRSYAFANWLPGGVNGEYFTNSIDFVVKEIITRPDWVSGNAMTFIFEVNSTGEAGTSVQFSAYESGAYAPKLIVEYIPTQPNGFESTAKSIEEQVNIYPNPAKDMISIDMKENNFDQVSIYNMVGQLVQEEAIELNTTKLDVNISSLAKGLHIVSLKNKDIAVSRRVIFQ